MRIAWNEGVFVETRNVQIDSLASSTPSPAATRSGGARPEGDADFRAALAEAGLAGRRDRSEAAAAAPEATSSAASAKAKRPSPEEKAAAARAANEALRKALTDYLNKSPAEHMREAVLARMGLSEESLKSMPPEQRAAVEAEIARRIKEWMLAKEEEQGGAIPPQHGVPDPSADAGALARSPAGMADFMALQAALAGAGHAS